MRKQREIKLGRGIADVQFGCSKQDVINTFGEPTVIDTIEDEEGKIEIFSYDNLDLSFTFEEINDFKLSSIAANNDNYHIREVIFTGMKKAKVLDVLEEINMLNYCEEDHSDDESPDHTLILVESKSLHLWFDNDILSEIEWFPLFDEDEEIIWPS